MRGRAKLAALWVALLTALGALSAPAQEPIPVSVQLQPREITVGDRITAELTLVWDGETPEGAPRFPAWQESWGEAEILEAAEVEAYEDPEGRRVYSQKLVLTAFTTGELALPEKTVAVPLGERTVEVPTREASFTVTSVLPPETATEGTAAGAPPPGAAGAAPGTPGGGAAELEPRPPAPLRELAVDRAFYATTAVMTVLLCLALYWLLRRLALSPAAAGVAPPPPPPLDELSRALRAIDPARPEPAHTAMSFALRRYLGRRLEFHALESTTAEIQRGLRRADVEADLARRVLKLLRDCDQVKFARLEVAGEETLDRIERLRLVARELENRFAANDDAWGAEEAGETGEALTDREKAA